MRSAILLSALLIAYKIDPSDLPPGIETFYLWAMIIFVVWDLLEAFE